MLLVTMAMSTFSLFAPAVLASEFQAEFDISKLQLGLLGAVNTGVGGLFAPTSGRLTDRIGGRNAMGTVLVFSAIACALIALSTTFWTLLAAMAIAGIPQGWGNPATNKAIATGVAVDQRGVLTGIKQSGVQLSVFISGAGLPFVARTAGWRTGLWIAVGLALAALAGLRSITVLDDEDPPDQQVAPSAGTTGQTATAKPPLPAFVYQVAAYGFLMGFVGGGIGRFLPLFGEEQVGLSPAMAGLVFALSGLVAIPVRIMSGASLDRGISARLTMTAMAGGAVVSCLLLVYAPSIALLLWIGAVLNGVTLGSWNTSANLAMIREMGSAGAGRATGILLFGFLIGLTVGGPFVGWSIDSFDSYTPAWLISAASCSLAAVVVARRLGERSVGEEQVQAVE